MAGRVNGNHAFVQNLPTTEEVKARINERYAKTCWRDDDGEVHPYVCTICDEVLLSTTSIDVIPFDKLKKVRRHLLWSELDTKDRIPAVEDHYSFTKPLPKGVSRKLLTGMALSPRGSVYKQTRRNGKAGLTICKCCKDALAGRKKVHVPMNAIINGNYVGCAPQCLTDLNPVELAFLAPTNMHGYCFTHTGGTQMQMKGTLSYLRVKERRVAEAAAALENLKLTEHVVVLCYGRMTEAQRKKVKDRTQVRTDKLIEAAKWLCENHANWKDVDYESIKTELQAKRVVRIDHSKTVESTNASIETEEIYTCYYPEGANTEHSGGFDDPESFVELADELQRANFDIELKANLEREFVSDYDGDQLVNTCLLQFPYGRCGRYESRLKPDGSVTSRPILGEYLDHLSRLSNPVFQTPMIQLISYSMITQLRILKSSKLKVKTAKFANDLVEGLNYNDVHETIKQHRLGNRFGGTRISRKFLESVEACSRSVPHTNEATKKARSTSEAMQHYNGSGSIFLTVTFDDENSILMQILSGEYVETQEDIETLSEEALKQIQRDRRQIRLKYPGFAAIHFEMLLEILVEEVVGWSMKENRPTEKPGLFGVCEAFCMAVEEQGRKTLHAHMTIWIKGYKALQKTMFFGRQKEKAVAERTVQAYYDRFASTELMSAFPKHTLQEAWDHECSTAKAHRDLPVVVMDQGLRILRHRKGYGAVNGTFARCPHCDKPYTYEELICCVLATTGSAGYTKEEIQPDNNNKYDIPRHRLYAEIVRHQKELFTAGTSTIAPETSIRAACQSHNSYHTDSCFKCTKTKDKKRKHVCGPTCECRYHRPDKKRKQTTIKTEYEGGDWYQWNGIKKTQPIVQVCVKRGTYDLFQNVCCTAISESGFACNSNVQMITDGPIGQYQFKYNFKKTQDDDQAEYSKLDDQIKRLEGRIHDDDSKEAVRRIRAAAFAHNKTNVISPSFASYLTRNESRFYFSHEFAFCPLQDVMKILDNEKVHSVLRYTDGGKGCYFENLALHYLCRNEELETLSLKDLWENYQVTPAKKKDDPNNPVYLFQPETEFFQHPAARKKKNGQFHPMKQGMKKRDESVGVKVSQWEFPDTSHFHGADICTCGPEKYNKAMENWSKRVLTFMLPHRCLSDLQDGSGRSFPYVRKLQDVFRSDQKRISSGSKPVLFTQRNIQFLQNIQDCARNSLRYKVKVDDLENGTQAYHPDGANHKDTFEEEEQHDELEEDAYYEMFLEQFGDLENTHDPADLDPTRLEAKLSDFNLKNLRGKGAWKCGFAGPDILKLEPRAENVTNFLQHESLPQINEDSGKQNVRYPGKQRFTRSWLVKVLLKKTIATPKGGILKDETPSLSEANGSIGSIIEWSKTIFARDRKQRRGFESIIASFLLTFFEDIEEDDGAEDMSGVNVISQFRTARQALLRLKGCKPGEKQDPQLIALLHGPGGSGKSTVINAITAYAKSYCDAIGHKFTDHTIMITAMSGVAATLLNGETTHSVMGLNCSKLPQEMVDKFQDARLLIVDEISFASPKDFQKLHENAIRLMGSMWKAYGGLNIVFAGDFSQLKPVRAPPVYNDYCPEFHGKLNTFIELDGKWRFSDDKEWGERLLRFREGCPTAEDINVINENCHVAVKDVPAGIQHATYRNANRDAINTALFEEYCSTYQPEDGSVLDSAVMIFMDNLTMNNKGKTPTPVMSNRVKRFFYENVGEDDCKMERYRVDPVLKLYHNCPLMLVANTDVANGQANGSTVRLQSVKMKYGEESFALRLKCGTRVRAMYASQVAHLTVKHERPDLSPQVFNVVSKDWSYKAKLRYDGDVSVAAMGGNQFPVVSNSCTTGHKLQGCSCDEILVNDWHYCSNWPYVVLSRVRTMQGLHIKQLLDPDLSKYAMPEEMTEMLNDFRERLALTELSDEDYELMLGYPQ